MRKPLPMLSQLFFSFMKVGLFTFGGGYAMISVITDTCVEKKRWLTQDEMMDLTVVAESTPGPIAINCATYVGYKMAGMTGAVLATLGIVLPSFVILYLISMFLEHFLEYKMIAAACRGIKVGVSLLILDAGSTMLKKMKKKTKKNKETVKEADSLAKGSLFLSKNFLKKIIKRDIIRIREEDRTSGRN